MIPLKSNDHIFGTLGNIEQLRLENEQLRNKISLLESGDLESHTSVTEIDQEIDCLIVIYNVFLGMDRASQIRALNWLNDRLECDHSKEKG